MLDRLRLIRESFAKYVEDLSEVRMPETFIATLRRGIARAVAGCSDGILLNFCSPEHARGVVNSPGASRQRLIVSCYLKIFYSRNERTANRMLIEEFASYNENPSYHGMFEAAGVAREIEQANKALGSKKIIRPSKNMMKISLANPADVELAAYVTSFREAGVDLPCLYPYFEPKEDEDFKISKVEEIVRL